MLAAFFFQEIVEITSAEQKKEKLLEMLEVDLKSYVANKGRFTMRNSFFYHILVGVFRC